VVGELNDRRAYRLWWEFVRVAGVYPILREVGEAEGVYGAPTWEAKMADRYHRLLRRLTRLERRR
jgi:hypothetical protein